MIKNNDSKDSVLAIVVSYNDPIALAETIKSIFHQVGHVVIIDNNSSGANKSEIGKLEAILDVEVIYLAENMGIGYALNIGLDIAVKKGFQWLLTMDQDSTADPLMVSLLISASLANRDASIVFPTTNLAHPCNHIERKDYTITSGNLVVVQYLSELGGYNEHLFIDGVDFDISLRMRNAGFSLLRVNSALLKHRLGEKESVKIIFFEISYTRHPPIRRYYIFRNHLYLTKMYFFKNFLFVFKKNIFMLIYFGQILIFEKNRWGNLTMIYKGLFDFIKNKQGPYL